MNDTIRESSADESIATLLSRVVADAEQVARSEIELQKAKVLTRIDEAKSAVGLLMASIATGSVALTALVVGALMVLTPAVGPLWATVIVVGVLAALAGLLGWLGMRQFKLVFGAAEETA
uniref:phage holin family protein n=1 Tax=uncultured Sphingomonas sp. TaxID=158754 RepID=UPI0035CC14B9